MKAVAIKEFGAPEGLELIDLPDPVPAAGQVVLAIEAIGVGGVDTVIRRGTLAGYGFEPGHILGGEVAGTVTELGDGVDPSWLGRRVWAFVGVGGGYAEQAVVAAAALVPLPQFVSTEDAVTLGSSGVVVHFALRHAHFTPGESVLVRGAAGGIGVMAVQLAARDGASTVAVTTSSPSRGERLTALGATQVLNRAAETSSAYDVIIDVVGGPGLPSLFAKLNPNGRLVTVGVIGGMPPADFGAGMLAAFQKSLSFATFSADTVPAADQRAMTAELLASDLKSVVHETLPLEQAVLAHKKMDAGEVFGRIVLIPQA